MWAIEAGIASVTSGANKGWFALAAACLEVRDATVSTLGAVASFVIDLHRNRVISKGAD